MKTMKKLTCIILIAIAISGCEKLTFDEYYQCEKDYKATMKSLDDQLKNHKITASKYNAAVQAAIATYDSCLIKQETDK